MSRESNRAEDFDWAKVKPGTPMSVWVRPAVDPATGVTVSPPVIWTGRFIGIDHPVPEAVPWVVIDDRGGARAGFALEDVAQIQLL